MEIITNRKPFFSVIINNYNYGRFIEEALDSVLGQTFPKNEMEVIVVDDGSSDDTAVRLRRYGDSIRCFFKANGGQASALNTGFINSRGEFIALLDADDYWHHEKLRYVAEEFQKSDGVDFVCHFMNVVDLHNKIIDRYVFPDYGEDYLKNYLKGVLPWSSPCSGMSVRAECLRKAMPVPEEFRIAADIYLHYTLPFYAGKLSVVKKRLGYSRLHNDNMSGGNLMTPVKLSREMDILLRIERHIAGQAGKLGYDASLISQRIESMALWYDVLIRSLKGEKLKALRDAALFNRFLPKDTFGYRLARKSALVLSVSLPPGLSLWLQRRYRMAVNSAYYLRGLLLSEQTNGI